MIELHNSLSRAVEVFVPQDPGCVSMYVCGPTVYDVPHLGNARPAVIFDTLYRLLRHTYGEHSVEFARNFTDIDDKIMERAAANGESIQTLTERVIRQYHEVTDALGCLRPNHEPRATAYIAPIIGSIAMLLLNKHAYISEGHVLFDVTSYPSHGALSRHLQADLQSGQHRVAEASYKRNQADFVLWKPSTPDQPGWDASFGRGRPGWHIECSAMIESIFADQTIDIHAGGADLRFPHHDCEISQFACSHHKPDRKLANYWLHNGMLLVEGEKMAKSAGNFFTVPDVVARGYTGPEIRLALLQTHYRSPLDFTDATLEGARTTLNRWRDALLPYTSMAPLNNPAAQGAIEALSSDLNTPLAITALHESASMLNTTKNPSVAQGMMYALDLLGFCWKQASVNEEEQALLDQRKAAREAGDYALSDRLRDALGARGIHVKDMRDGTLWWRS
ncbi:MAG: cysteine--tRNA ligase [Verrucomicrobiaceae bacterium]|nr:MAG: cysteine--tRNA ligase [Verrucomicrobiaceae bacterium]